MVRTIRCTSHDWRCRCLLGRLVAQNSTEILLEIYNSSYSDVVGVREGASEAAVLSEMDGEPVVVGVREGSSDAKTSSEGAAGSLTGDVGGTESGLKEGSFVTATVAGSKVGSGGQPHSSRRYSLSCISA